MKTVLCQKGDTLPLKPILNYDSPNTWNTARRKHYCMTGEIENRRDITNKSRLQKPTLEPNNRKDVGSR